ncbi:Mbeg1-like protein [Thermophilibacter provencensis]|uniref:DUF2974 domain-containing protein n=1 Tax=Thermophilibacter provencensis TaxID=1852386 RepID=A0ABT7V5A2_9ACTN|nr:Mbeg1-like protein [Thermophilibacter provencensis]MDM8271782.1 DUF2974 domain-containing protein [Thermophilibacter provencensis]
MADVRDYLELRGDIALAERPFNDVDNLALATLAYLDLTGIVGAPGEKGLRLTDACGELLERAGGDLTARVRSLATIDERFVVALGGSARLGDAILRDYVDVRDDERVMQFSAVTVDLESGETYVAFRGTDTTLVGWRENFVLSFAVTQAQRAAADYLARELERAVEKGHRVRVGGHSKGGNLAAYAAACAPVALAGAVERVYSNDGPGMDRSVMPVSCHDVMGERYTRIIPAYSVVGRFFTDDAPATIVRSSAERSLQHDPLTWQVGPAGFLEADGPDPECLVVAEAFSSWLARLAPEDRRLLTDELFDALAAGGAERFEDVLASPAAAQKVLSALGGVDVRTRDMMFSLLGELVGASATAARDAVARRAESLLGRRSE